MRWFFFFSIIVLLQLPTNALSVVMRIDPSKSKVQTTFWGNWPWYYDGPPDDAVEFPISGTFDLQVIPANDCTPPHIKFTNIDVKLNHESGRKWEFPIFEGVYNAPSIHGSEDFCFFFLNYDSCFSGSCLSMGNFGYYSGSFENQHLTLNGGKEMGLGSNSYIYILDAHVVNDLSVKITGTGAVTGSSETAGIPQNINCSNGVLGTCAAAYIQGSTVTLVSMPPWYSAVEWSGCTTWSGNECQVNMNNNMSVTATFSEQPNTRLGGSSYKSISDAYAAFSKNDTIMAKDSSVLTFVENLLFDKAYDVKLDGGKDFSWNDHHAFSLISGAVIISNGKVVFNKVKIK